MKLLAALVGVWLAAQAAPVRQTAPRDAREALQPRGAGPYEVLFAEKAWAGADVLLPLTRSGDPGVRTAAVRALGRLEDPSLVSPLLTLSGVGFSVRANAIAQSLHGFDPARDPKLVQAAFDAMHTVASVPLSMETVFGVTAALGPLSRIRYSLDDQVHKIEAILVRVANFTQSDRKLQGLYLSAAGSFETLFRVNGRTAAPLEATVERLEKMVAANNINDGAEVRQLAFAALVAGRSVTTDSVREALDDRENWQTRRLAVALLGGGGGGLEELELSRRIAEALKDAAPQIRYEALRAYVRRSMKTEGCGPIMDLMNDADPHVSLAAIDALGDGCKEDPIVTERLVGNLRVPPTIGSWHRDTHVFISAAKRSPESIKLYAQAFTNHPVWWVRMYSANAMAAAGDLLHLEKLVFDADDNVREAALDSWVRLKKAEAEPALLSALERTDIQLVRTAAGFLKDFPATPRYFRHLSASIMRLTAEGKETSRDARLALLDAMVVHAPGTEVTELNPLLKDFDPTIAQRAAEVITRLNGKPVAADPKPYVRGWPQAFWDLRQCVAVRMDSGKSFRMRMEPAAAPVAVDRFLKLALTDRYYNGLTFHRVAPNFVIQGGSPGANEYAGHKEYMRDEIASRHVRGTVGLSTRGRNTGDAQIFVNLVDNLRLNDDYTMFATVYEGMDVVDGIQEGDVIRAIDSTPCPKR